MHEVVRSIERPASELVTAFQGLPTAVLSDVMGSYEQTLSHEIKPIYDGASAAGSALTVKTYPGDNLMIHKAVTLAEPGDVLVIDASGYAEAGLWGELVSMSCAEHGLAGTVIDGAARDVAEIEALDYPVFARAISPKGSYKGHPGSINVHISCGGTTVEPGDIVVGDDEGVAVVPADQAEDTLEAAREKIAAEEAMQERIRAGEYIYDINEYEERYAALDITER
jgi:4-hydroxy-4-methyl-2-oxoglutarate aldolase